MTTLDARRFADAARAARVPVNVIDKPAYCDFSFGAIVNRSPLVIGISTDGAAPVFAPGDPRQARSHDPAAVLPAGRTRRGAGARRCSRPAFRSRPGGGSGRRSRRFALAHPDRKPAQSDFDAFLHQTRAEAPAAAAGSITLVGAGPGDPELLTLRAVRALQSADVILIDDLVAPELLDFARREATKMLIGSTGHFAPGRPDDISTTMTTLAQSGKRVVWLKHGDPTTFGRPGREIAACRAAGIDIEVVPGIAAAAAPRVQFS